jgi:2-polyprenyl-3-methyl-5-hydroxy-6-metoxy-1,4-benzoquinol methylase
MNLVFSFDSQSFAGTRMSSNAVSHPPPIEALPLPFTGERFIPGIEGEIWIEHWHRYHFIAPLVAGKQVLDVACGEGYGSHLLRQGPNAAASVAGVDIASAAIANARRRYGRDVALSFHEASCTELPFASEQFDVVVSFETVEHIEAQSTFMAEIRRVLKPNGVLILSCPNKAEYTDRRQFDNTYHVRELYRNELENLVRNTFAVTRWLGQKNGLYSVIWEEDGDLGRAEVIETTLEHASIAAPNLQNPLYFLLFAAQSADVVARLQRRLSLFSDQREWLYEDYRRVTRDLARLQRLHDELHAEFNARTAAMLAAQAELAALRSR